MNNTTTPAMQDRERRLTMRGFVAGAAIVAVAAGATWLISAPATAEPATHRAAAVTPAAISPAANTSSATPVSESYQQGAWVATLQQNLAQLGYYTGGIDGIYGPGTTAAVEAFQSANGLSVDGDAGPLTMAKISEDLAGGSSQTGSGSGSGSGSAPIQAATLTPAHGSNAIPSKPSNQTPVTPSGNHSASTGAAGSGSGGSNGSSPGTDGGSSSAPQAGSGSQTGNGSATHSTTTGGTSGSGQVQ